MKVYTKTGDKGHTSLINGKRVKKFHPQIEAYGNADLVNSNIGVLVVKARESNIVNDTELELLLQIQKNLFNIGSALASTTSQEIEKFLKMNLSDIEVLEAKIDSWEEELDPLKNFILPGGSEAAAFAHICRCSTRELERRVWQLENEDFSLVCKYLNRLSDFFFVLSRVLNKRLGINEVLWT